LLPLQIYPRKNKRKTYLAASTALSQEEQEINIPCCLYMFISSSSWDKSVEAARYVFLLFFLG
jgi:hypothetical protein